MVRGLEVPEVAGFMHRSHLIKFHCGELSLGGILVHELWDTRQEDQLRAVRSEKQLDVEAETKGEEALEERRDRNGGTVLHALLEES